MRPRAGLTRGLAVAVAAATCLGGAVVASPATAATGSLRLVCSDVGSVTAELSADGRSARILGDAVVRLVGRPGVEGRDRAGQPLAVAPSEPGVRCTTRPGDLARYPGLLPHGIPGGTGRLVFSATVDTAAVLADAPRAAADSRTTRFPYESRIAAYLATRSGSVTVALRRTATDQVFVYTKGSSTNITASIVKVSVMAAVMRRAQALGRGLTTAEKSLMTSMIRLSDNDATTDLWDSLGGAPALVRFWSAAGCVSTYPDPGGRWGLTTTTAPDQTRVADVFAYPNSLLTEANRTYGLGLMRTVSSAQDWGVTAGPPTGTVAVKNGWLGRTDGWHVNSIGAGTAYPPGPYTVAVLTHSSTTGMSTQIATIEGLSRVLFAEEKRGVRGDFTKDGIPDLYGLTELGTLRLFPGKGNGQLGLGPVVATGWTGLTWLGSPGDVNADGVSDLLSVTKAGSLIFWPGSGTGTFPRGWRIGSGWQTFTAITAAGDIDGNGRLDLAVRSTDGKLRLYEVTSSAIRPVRELGSSFLPFDWFLGSTDFTGDRLGDLLTLSKGENLYAWRSTGTAYTPVARVQDDFGEYAWYAVPGDLSGDRRDDLVVRTQAGTWLWFPLAKDGSLGTRRGTGIFAPLYTRIF